MPFWTPQWGVSTQWTWHCWVSPEILGFENVHFEQTVLYILRHILQQTESVAATIAFYSGDDNNWDLMEVGDTVWAMNMLRNRLKCVRYVALLVSETGLWGCCETDWDSGKWEQSGKHSVSSICLWGFDYLPPHTSSSSRMNKMNHNHSASFDAD